MKHRFFPKKWSDINSSSNKLARMNTAKWISKLDSFLEFLLYRLWSHDIPELWSNSITSHKESLFTNFAHCCRQHFFASFIVSLIRVVGRKKLKIFLLPEFFFFVSLKWKIFFLRNFDLSRNWVVDEFLTFFGVEHFTTALLTLEIALLLTWVRISVLHGGVEDADIGDLVN